MTDTAHPFLYSLLALVSLLPACLAAYRRSAGRDAVFWATTAVALAGPVLLCIVKLSSTWQTGLSTSLWITIAGCMVLYSVLSAGVGVVWRLGPLLLPYLVIVAAIAIVWDQAPGRPLPADTPVAWVEVHIAFAVLTYCLLTVAAVAGVAVMLQESALKTKRPTRRTELLPAVAEAESMQVGLLLATEVVLGCGLLTGIATQFMETGGVLVINHKTVLSVVAFVVIGGLLVAHFRTGMRGRRAARLVLLAYLLVTLGYPGVKFVTDVLLA
jgi:ABC-type uncharacterized transport system permease subunit